MSPDVAKANAVIGQQKASAGLTDLVISSLEALAAAGQPDAACRFAGQACAALRKDDPRSWRRFNALLHRLSKSVA